VNDKVFLENLSIDLKEIIEETQAARSDIKKLANSFEDSSEKQEQLFELVTWIESIKEEIEEIQEEINYLKSF
jgi:seryl-tRNA synthetase